MRKKALTEDQMSTVEYVDRAVWWSKELTRLRARGPGDIENAMRSLERDYGIDYWAIWRLRYRRGQIKDIGISIYARLEAAYYRECERQRAKLAREIAATKLVAGVDDAVVCAAETVLRTTKKR